MLKGLYLGKNPPIFKMNPVVKAFILSEIFFWSGWNFIIPIISVFVVKDIHGATVQSATTAFTCHLLVRIAVELFVSSKIAKASNRLRVILDMIGMSILSIAYVGIALFTSIESLFIFYIIAGISFGVSSPAKLSLFSKNLERNNESTIWGVYDALVLVGMALAASVGGFVANAFGFKTLFLLASFVNILGISPYVFYIIKERPTLIRRKKTVPAELATEKVYVD